MGCIASIPKLRDTRNRLIPTWTGILSSGEAGVEWKMDSDIDCGMIGKSAIMVQPIAEAQREPSKFDSRVQTLAYEDPELPVSR